MKLDYGRLCDLEDLEKVLKKGDLSRAQRDHLQGLVNQILNESTEIRELRMGLVKAFRNGDTNAFRNFRMRIQHQKLEETRGRSWGSNKENNQWRI